MSEAAAAGVEARYVDRAGASLYVETCGAGAPVVLLHGWPLDHRAFTFQVPELATRFLVVNFDRRGFGRSTGPADLLRELDDIDHILDALDLDRVHLLGMSQGGRIALRYAVTRHDRLRSLILQGAAVDGLAVSGSDPERIPLAEYAAMVRDGRLDAFREAWLRHPLMELPADRAAAAALVRRMLEDYDGADLREYSEQAYHFLLDVPALLTRVRVPALVITGARETATRKAIAARLAKLLPHASACEIAGAGHL